MFLFISASRQRVGLTATGPYGDKPGSQKPSELTKCSSVYQNYTKNLTKPLILRSNRAMRVVTLRHVSPL
jgi:hypothetical protein